MSTRPLDSIAHHPVTHKQSILCRTMARAKISQKRSEAEHSLKKPEATILKSAARTYAITRHSGPSPALNHCSPPPRAQIHQYAMRPNQQSGAKRVKSTTTKRATHLRVFSETHMTDPGKLAASCTSTSFKTTLLSVTVKVHEKVGLRGKERKGKFNDK